MNQKGKSDNSEKGAAAQSIFSPEDYVAIEAYYKFKSKWEKLVVGRMEKGLHEELSVDRKMEDQAKELGADDERSEALLMRALKTKEWSDYTQHLVEQGIAFAKAGFDFQDLLKIMHRFRDQVNRYILQEHPNDPRQVSLVWLGAHKLGDLKLTTVSQSYFAEKERQLQKEQLAKSKALKSLKRSKEKLKQLSEELEDKVEERTTELKAINAELESFSYTVSHDLRAPLRAIGGYARMLNKKAEHNLTEEQKRYVDVIIESVAKMGTLIDDLLLYSRIGRANVNRSTIDMEQLAKRVFEETVDPEMDSKAKLKIEDLPKARADWEMLKRVFSNLFANALKFSGHSEKPVIVVSGSKNEKETVYCVEDNGVGFEMEYVHKLFGMFQRLHSDDEYQGTGVGLAIVQRIIHKHGGQVWAKGEPGKGASFYFSLPQNERLIND